MLIERYFILLNFTLEAKLFKECRKLARVNKFTKVVFDDEKLSKLLFFALLSISRILFKHFDDDDNLFTDNRSQASVRLAWTNLAGHIGQHYS